MASFCAVSRRTLSCGSVLLYLLFLPLDAPDVHLECPKAMPAKGAQEALSEAYVAR